MTASSRMFLSWLLGAFTLMAADDGFSWRSGLYLGVFVVWLALVFTSEESL